MATAKDVGGPQFSYSLGSEDMCDLVCQPCQLDGQLHVAVGLCIDCQEYLCQKCYDAHTLPTPMRNHKLLNKKQMLDSQISLEKKDKCSEKCLVHGDRTVKYYCINHCYLGCSVCITLDHRSCDGVRYIPHVAKDLANNQEYKQAERQLELVVKRSNRVTEHYKQTIGSLEKNCSEAVKTVQEFRNEINQTLNKIGTDLVKSCETLKLEEIKKINQVLNKIKTAQKEVNALFAMKERYENNKQKCNLYTAMMKIKEKLKAAEDRIKEAETGQLSKNIHIRFVGNIETLNTLKQPEAFGKLLKTEIVSALRSEKTRESMPDVKKAATRTTVTQAETIPDVKKEEKRTTIIQTEAIPDEKKEETRTTVIHAEAIPDVRMEETRTTVIHAEAIPGVKKEETRTTVIHAEAIPGVKKEETRIIVIQTEKIPDVLKEETRTAVIQRETLPDVKKEEPRTIVIQAETIPDVKKEETRAAVNVMPAKATLAIKKEETRTTVIQAEATPDVKKGETRTTVIQTEAIPDVKKEETRTTVIPSKPIPAVEKEEKRTIVIHAAEVPDVKKKETRTTVIQAETTPDVKNEETRTTAVHAAAIPDVKKKETRTAVIQAETIPDVKEEDTRTTAIHAAAIPDVKKEETRTIVTAEYVQDIKVKSKSDKNTSNITGLVVLPGSRLLVTDYMEWKLGNGNIKLVDIQHGKVITHLTLSTSPWDAAMITNNQIVVTMPHSNKAAIVNVAATDMTVDRTLNMEGACQGVDYRDGKLAVSFDYPSKVQVLTLQGQVLYTITNDKKGRNLFKTPHYVVFGQDNTSLYVSNRNSNNVVHVKFDGTVLGTYTDRKLQISRALLTDSSGSVYVCGQNSNNIHQVTADCRKVQVLLKGSDGLQSPCCVGYSESEGRLYVGELHSNVVKVYRVFLGISILTPFQF